MLNTVCTGSARNPLYTAAHILPVSFAVLLAWALLQGKERRRVVSTGQYPLWHVVSAKVVNELLNLFDGVGFASAAGRPLAPIAGARVGVLKVK